MSNMKSDAIEAQGIEIVKQIPIPEHMIPEDAKVEMDAKKAAGYFTDGEVPTSNELSEQRGRKLQDY